MATAPPPPSIKRFFRVRESLSDIDHDGVADFIESAAGTSCGYADLLPGAPLAQELAVARPPPASHHSRKLPSLIPAPLLARFPPPPPSPTRLRSSLWRKSLINSPLRERHFRMRLWQNPTAERNSRAEKSHFRTGISFFRSVARFFRAKTPLFRPKLQHSRPEIA